jgi:hypothetical protein
VTNTDLREKLMKQYKLTEREANLIMEHRKLMDDQGPAGAASRSRALGMWQACRMLTPRKADTYYDASMWLKREIANGSES